jgi:hypothetical protein
MQKRIKAFFRHSLTILWARLVALVGLLLAISDPLLELFALPDVNNQVRAMLDPKYVPFYVIAIAVVTELARRRSLPNSPKKDGV